MILIAGRESIAPSVSSAALHCPGTVGGLCVCAHDKWHPAVNERSTAAICLLAKRATHWR